MAQQPQEGVSIQDLTQMAEGIVQRLNQGNIPDGDQYQGIRQLSDNVLGNARIVKQHEIYIFQKLRTITAGLLQLLGQSSDGLEGLRQAIQQIDANAIPSNVLNQINEALMQAPTRPQIRERIDQLRVMMREQGVNQDIINQLLPQNSPTPEEVPYLIGEQRDQDEPEVGQQQRVQAMPGSVPQMALDRQEQTARNQGTRGGRPRKTKKRGGYGWSGKKGVEVRSSIRTTKRSKSKKGKRSSSGKKKTKKRFSGKK